MELLVPIQAPARDGPAKLIARSALSLNFSADGRRVVFRFR